MKPYDLFNKIINFKYRKTGKDLDWGIEVDDIEQKIRVLFKGSCSKLDWFFNFLFMIFPTVIGGCPYWFSVGWWAAWESSKKLILHSILNCMYYCPDYKVEVCGYSFGGAIAQICGIEIFEATGIKPNLVTFGSPKPLFSFFTKLKAKRCFNNIEQYSHWNDIVTWCPPLIGYHNIKNIRIGKFDLKGLFNPKKYHQIYSNESLYK